METDQTRVRPEVRGKTITGGLVGARIAEIPSSCDGLNRAVESSFRVISSVLSDPKDGGNRVVNQSVTSMTQLERYAVDSISAAREADVRHSNDQQRGRGNIFTDGTVNTCLCTDLVRSLRVELKKRNLAAGRRANNECPP